MKSPFPRAVPKGAFTLIELLTVIAIIAILASLILSTAGYVQEKAGNDRTKVEIEVINTALENYKIDNGNYPDGDGSADSTKNLLKVLMPQTGKVYLGSTKMLEISKTSDAGYYTNNRLVDFFGNPYRYYFSSAVGAPANNPVTNTQNNGPAFPDIWSYGKNGPTQNATTPEKWIKNW